MHLRDYTDRYEFSSYSTAILKLSLSKSAEYKFKILDKWNSEKFEVYFVKDLNKVDFEYQKLGIVYQLKYHTAIIMGKPVITDALQLALNDIEYK